MNFQLRSVALLALIAASAHAAKPKPKIDAPAPAMSVSPRGLQVQLTPADLVGKANIDAWVTPYHQASPELLDETRSVLKNGGPYAVIHFNMGLHGWVKGRIPEGQYTPLMTRWVKSLEEESRGGRLIWASTTPVASKSQKGQAIGLDTEINPTIVAKNALAASIMGNEKIPVDDLYALMSDKLELAHGDQFHRTKEGSKLQAGTVAASILAQLATQAQPTSTQPAGSVDAAAFGFSPDATGGDNTKALQRAVDQGGNIVVTKPGTYSIAGTVYVGSNTSVIFSDGVFLKKVTDQGPFSHVLLNKGALTRTYDQHITIDGLQIIVNGVDVRTFKDVYGLHGQLAFFYIKDLHIKRFRCLDLGKLQYGIHVCTFQNIVIDDVIIKGQKDGVHLGRGKHFVISNGVFQTGDDAVALNGHDYSVGNPELGWIEDGVVENCRDLADPNQHAGYFCRILAGAWIDWHAGMEVQQSDTVVSNGRVYRVQMKPDGTVYKSMTPPTQASGSMVLDGINWGMVQTDATYTAGVRNVVFRHIVLEKPRTAFSVHFDIGKYSRSYYPGAKIPMQEKLVFEDVQIKHDQKTDFLSIGTPVDVVSLVNCSLRNNPIDFHGEKAMPDYLKTTLNLTGCTFNFPGTMDLVVNSVPGKVVELKTSGSVEPSPKFTAKVIQGDGTITVDSDLPGLKK